MNIAEIAARNHAARMAQLQRLAPVRQQAKAKAAMFRDAQSGAKDTRAAFELMQNLKHVPNFFPTPRALVRRMIELAGMQDCFRVLEPSAGKGDIVKAIPCTDVVAIEYNRTLAEHLRSTFPQFDVRCADFLTMEPDPTFDRVLMNPPFERGIDAEHIKHAHKFLKPGGRMIAIACAPTGLKLDAWIADRGGYCEPLPAGTFAQSERPTAVNTCLIVI